MPDGMLLFFALAACGPEPASPPGPAEVLTGPPTETMPAFEGRVPANLVMVSIDTLRRDHVGRYDPSGPSTTPFLDSLMRDGFVLDDHTTCSSWTYHGISCTLLGADPSHLGVVPKLEPATSRVPWPDDLGDVFLATRLQRAGFHTVLSTANGFLAPTWGTAGGYDDFSGQAFDPAATVFEGGLSSLLAAIDSGTAERWFLHVHLLEPHAPYLMHDGYTPDLSDLDAVAYDLDQKGGHYDATGEWPTLGAAEQANLEETLRRRYRGEVGYLDSLLQSFFSDLGRQGLLDDTLVVIWSDHGEAFWEFGHQSHGYTLHRPENDGILMFWAPNIVAGAWDGPTTAVDLVPTLLGLFDLPVPDYVTGTPVGLAPEDRPRFAASIARAGAIQSVRQGHLKLHYRWSGAVGFFDLDADPWEEEAAWDPTDPAQVALWDLLAPEVARYLPLVPEYRAVAPAGVSLP